MYEPLLQAAHPPRGARPGASAAPHLRIPSLNRGDSGASFSGRTASAHTSPRPINDTDHLSNLKVAVRIRPMSHAESTRGDEPIYDIQPDRQTLQIVSGQLRTTPASSLKSFTFHSCLAPSVQQDQVMSICGVPQLLDAALLGYHASILAYGQTGSGKTYTMSGREDVISEVDYEGNHPEDGLITRSVRHVFHQVEQRRKASPDEDFTLRASYCEIYNELCYDLLAEHLTTPQALQHGPKPLAVRWDVQKGFHVPDLKVVQCVSMKDVLAILSQGMKNRRIGSHELNRESSRSHSIFTLYVEARPSSHGTGDALARLGKVSFVDLAGSERLKMTKSTGEMVKETSNINRSLFTLGKVISTLSELHRRAGQPGGTQVPYRESLLTKLLADSLGGSALTLMIACCSPSSAYLDETLSTLQYAVKAKAIQNRPTVQLEAQDNSVAQLRRELQLLRSENAYLRQQAHTQATPTPRSVPSPLSAAATPLAPQGAFRPPVHPSPAAATSAQHASSSAPGTPSRLGVYQSPATLEHSLVALEHPSSRPALKALSAAGIALDGSRAAVIDEGLPKPELVQRLRDAHELLVAFFNENDQLAREMERLRAQRQLLALDHRGVAEENDRLQQKVIILERMLRDVGVLPPGTPVAGYGSGPDSRGHHVYGRTLSGASTPGREGPPLPLVGASSFSAAAAAAAHGGVSAKRLWEAQPGGTLSRSGSQTGGPRTPLASGAGPGPSIDLGATRHAYPGSEPVLSPRLRTGSQQQRTYQTVLEEARQEARVSAEGADAVNGRRSSSFRELHVDVPTANGETPRVYQPSRLAASLTPRHQSPGPGPSSAPEVVPMQAASIGSSSAPSDPALALASRKSSPSRSVVPLARGLSHGTSVHRGASGKDKKQSTAMHMGSATTVPVTTAAAAGGPSAGSGSGAHGTGAGANGSGSGGKIAVSADKLSLLFG